MEQNTSGTLIHVTTVARSLGFFRGQIEFMRARGLRVEAIAASSKELMSFGEEQSIPVHSANLRRSISPLQDLQAIVELVLIFRKTRPDIVHASTPKGGLVGMIAASIYRRPRRIYHMLGLPYLTAVGRKHTLLKLSERVSCHLAHRVFCVSPSIRAVAISDRLCAADKIVVLGNGSVNGVDAHHAYNPANHHPESRARLRSRYGCSEEHFLVGFVGRVVRDKGAEELAAAWEVIADRSPLARLFFVGECEAQDPIAPHALEYLQNTPSVVFVGHLEDPSALYAIFDLVVLPTYREGFGNVLIEAASMGLPVVATNVPGCVDAVQDGVTGTLVEPRDVKALTCAILLYMLSATLRARHGEAGRERVLQAFRREIVWEAAYDEYIGLLGGRPGFLPNLPESKRRRGMASRLIGLGCKRAIDVTASAVLLVCLFPVMLLTALAVRSRLGSPIFFRQTRPGYQGKPFAVIKFRTMLNAEGGQGRWLSDDERLTPFGRALRGTSLDELPQLLNVIRGDMSLVGPRPLLMEYLDLYTPEQQRRHAMRPGLTGLAQVNGRNQLSWEERFALDVWYVDHWSLWLDIRIVAKTVRKVIFREGISGKGTATMSAFTGSTERTR